MQCLMCLELSHSHVSELLILYVYTGSKSTQLSLIVLDNSEEAAIGAAQSLARSDYAGVIAWKRTAQIAGGRDGTPEVLYQVGEVPVLE